MRQLVLGVPARALAASRASGRSSRLVGAGATHECGSGDLLETGGAHALARRRGERTTSQHFARCELRVEGYLEEGAGWVVVLICSKSSNPQSKSLASGSRRGSSRCAAAELRALLPRPRRFRPAEGEKASCLPIPTCFASVD